MKDYLLVLTGGALGAVARFQIGKSLMRGQYLLGAMRDFPVATVIVNILGGFAIGLLTAWLSRTDGTDESWRLLLGVGLLGGFTTFSAFSLDTVKMIQAGQNSAALAYVIVSVLGSILAVMAGLMLMRPVT